MPDYRLLENAGLDATVQKRLGSVFVSKTTRGFLDQLINGQGRNQFEECLERHCSGDFGQVPSEVVQKELGLWEEDRRYSIFWIGDMVHVETDRRNGRTFVWLGCEDMRPPAR